MPPFRPPFSTPGAALQDLLAAAYAPPGQLPGHFWLAQLRHKNNTEQHSACVRRPRACHCQLNMCTVDGTHSTLPTRRAAVSGRRPPLTGTSELSDD